MDLPARTKLYGFSGLSAVGAQFAPGFASSPGDSETVAMVKIIAQVAPIVLPLLMDGAEKVTRALAEAFSAFQSTKSEAVKIVEAAKARVDGP